MMAKKCLDMSDNASSRKSICEARAPAAPSPNPKNFVAGFNTLDVFKHMMKTQNQHRIYNSKVKYLKYRRVIVDWLAEVAREHFAMQAHTTHVAVAYFDRILQTSVVDRDRLQMVALCTLLVAAKHEEREADVPEISELVHELRYQYEPRDICEMEILVLNRLKWQLSEYTPLHFLAHFLHRGVLYEDDMIQQSNNAASLKRIRKYLRRYTNFFAELAMQDYAFQAYPSSIVAASIVVASRKAINIVPMWRPEMESLLSCKVEDIRACVTQVWRLYEEQNIVVQKPVESPDNVRAVPH